MCLPLFFPHCMPLLPTVPIVPSASAASDWAQRRQVGEKGLGGREGRRPGGKGGLGRVGGNRLQKSADLTGLLRSAARKQDFEEGSETSTSQPSKAWWVDLDLGGLMGAFVSTSMGSKDSSKDLYFDVGSDKEPVVYSTRYDITFMSLEKLHPFDSTKWKRVLKFLEDDGRITPSQVVEPRPASHDDLLMVHTEDYLKSLKSSLNVADIAEMAPLALLPNPVIQQRLLQPFRHQVGGSVLAGKLAMERGWALNVGGGFHHACGHSGGGFCVYADITLLVHYARKKLGLERIMIIDLDAHQGNGHGRDFIDDSNVFIFDMYNCNIYPQDLEAKEGISLKEEIRSGTSTDRYLELVDSDTQEAFRRFSPQLVVYNAGTDILEGDPLGRLEVSPAGVVTRDEIVFSTCRQKGVPVVMLTSGGYQKNNAEIIAQSVGNLADKGLISLRKRAENDRLPSSS